MNRQLLEVLVSSSVLILALSAMRLVLRGKISPRLQYGLWLLAAVRLLLQVGRRLERYGRPCHGNPDSDSHTNPDRSTRADTDGSACRAACGSICGIGRNTGFADRRA